MSIDEARVVLGAIEGASDAESIGALHRLVVEYARLRTDWQLADRDAHHNMDAHRSRVHDALIDACNILARRMRSRGEDAGWRLVLGDDRKRIGDWACLAHALLGLRAR